jgi:hypothetical protein
MGEANGRQIDGIPQRKFFLAETNGLDAEVIRDVLRGELPAAIFRNCLSQSACVKAASIFVDNETIGRRADCVPAKVLGAYHYGRPLVEYLCAAQASRADVARLMSIAGLDVLRSSVARALADLSMSFRLARHRDLEAGEFVIRQWDGSGAYALQPHEDLAQLSSPLQIGFEIQQCDRVVALNACLCNDIGAGEVIMWNTRPSEQVRSRLGLKYSGYPYPLDYLQGIQSFKLTIATGDVYIINGAFVHAVLAVGRQSERISAACFLGQLERTNVVISWT